MGAKRLLSPSLPTCPVVPLTDLTSGLFCERGKCWLYRDTWQVLCQLILSLVTHAKMILDALVFRS